MMQIEFVYILTAYHIYLLIPLFIKREQHSESLSLYFREIWKIFKNQLFHISLNSNYSFNHMFFHHLNPILFTSISFALLRRVRTVLSGKSSFWAISSYANSFINLILATSQYFSSSSSIWFRSIEYS